MKKTAAKRSILSRLLFLIYCILMLWLLFGQRMEGGKLSISFGNSGENVNFVPFETVRLYLRLLQNGASRVLLHHAMINLVGNVIMFVPLGWFLPAIWEKLQAFFKTILLAVGIICAVEAVQYLTMLGSCDIDDLILNLLGVILGHGLWRSTRK